MVERGVANADTADRYRSPAPFRCLWHRNNDGIRGARGLASHGWMRMPREETSLLQRGCGIDPALYGDVAQLLERLPCKQDVVG